ncbi:MAG: type II toxin-antitoxin system prevent-host-death family antitoxin [Sphingomonas sp.]
MTKFIGAAEFKAKCLKLIDEMQTNGESITITKRGKPVATMSVIKEEKRPLKPLFGILKGSVLKYDDPFEPAVDPAEWDSNNPAGL